MNAITLWAAATALLCAGTAQAQTADPPRPATQQPGRSMGVPTGDVPTTPGLAPSTSNAGQAPGASPSPEQGPASGTGLPRPGTRPGNPPQGDRQGSGEGRGG